jgi:hypothetical protein
MTEAALTYVGVCRSNGRPGKSEMKIKRTWQHEANTGRSIRKCLGQEMLGTTDDPPEVERRCVEPFAGRSNLLSSVSRN